MHSGVSDEEEKALKVSLDGIFLMNILSGFLIMTLKRLKLFKNYF